MRFFFDSYKDIIKVQNGSESQKVFHWANKLTVRLELYISNQELSPFGLDHLGNGLAVCRKPAGNRIRRQTDLVYFLGDQVLNST